MATYKVEYVPPSPASVVDITNFVHTIDHVTFYSDGRIDIANFTLQAAFGQFITDDTGGLTPLLKAFDRIRFTFTDSDGNAQAKIFELKDDLGQVNKMSQYLLPLTLEGRERNLSFAPFSGYFDPPINHFQIFDQIARVYNDTSVFPGQPSLSFNVSDIDLPEFNPNFWDFQYIDNCLDALKAIVRSANLSVAAGGAGDRFSIVFEDVQGNDDVLLIKIKSQGSNNAGQPFVTITGDEIFTPIQRLAKIKKPVTGTVSVARGRPGSGGTPRQGDQYRARLEFYEETEPYSDTTTYAIGARVQHGTQTTNPEIAIGQVYEAIAETTGNTPPNASFWKTLSAFEFIGNIQYSPFTQDKAALYKNECTNPSASFDSDSDISPKMLDCNIVINDVETKRDYVDIRSNTDIVNSLTADQRKYLFLEDDFYNGFRMLVDVAGLGTGTGSFSPSLDAFGTGAGNDPNGRPYANNHVVYLDSVWFVIKEHENFDQIVVRQEGLYEWNITFQAGSRFPASDETNANRRFRGPSAGTPNGWQKLDGQFLANDCLHSPSSITNIQGLIHPVQTTGGAFYTDNSAVRIIYEYGPEAEREEWRDVLDKVIGFFARTQGFIGTFAASAVQNLYNLFLTPQYRNAGWWITFTAPWPYNTHNSIGEEVGQLYGGQTLLELNNHPFFDAFNQRVALSGKAGWNEVDSADLMEITGVTFLFRLNITANGSTIPFTGEIPVSYWVMDSNGTLWKSKDTYRFLNDVQRFTFNFGDFSPVYRARSPFGISNIVTNILVPELEIRERLFPSRIKLQGFMLEAPYDEHGRYFPNAWETIIKPTIFGMFNPTQIGTTVQFIGDFDYFQWVKTPIGIENGSSFSITPDRAIFPEFRDYPNITNLEQLQRVATADFNVEFFQFEQYSAVQNDKADLNLQDTVYLREQYLINDADQTLAKTNAWVSATTYFPNDIVNEGGTIYAAIVKHTSSGANQPPNPAFWTDLGSTAVPNTRELFVSEMTFSVTNGKNWNRNATFVRRIPKVTN